MTAVPPFKESSRELIVEVARALEPYFPDITNQWREKLIAEFGFDGRTLAGLERLTLAAGCSYFCHNDFPGFEENLQYFGTRLSKLRRGPVAGVVLALLRSVYRGPFSGA